MELKGTPLPLKDEFAAETSSSSASFTVEVTVLSAEEVVFGERWRRPLDHGAYAKVYTDKSTASTGVNSEKGHCNGYPYWGEAVHVTVSEHATAIEVVIYRRQEPVAAASVPVADFSVGPPGHLHCLSYRLFDTAGSRINSRNGIVNITVKRLDGPAVPRGEGKGGKAVDDAASGTGDSCCGGVAGKGKVTPAAAPAPAGAVMGYPVEFSAAGQAKGKGCV